MEVIELIKLKKLIGLKREGEEVDQVKEVNWVGVLPQEARRPKGHHLVVTTVKNREIYMSHRLLRT
jgi:hypothetical protein